MKEQPVSFELAKLANKKGFRKVPRYGIEASLYDIKGNHVHYSNYGFMGSGLTDGYIPAPTLSSIQTELRKRYDIIILVGYIEVYDDDNLKYYYSNPLEPRELELDDYHETYEEALEQGIKDTLLSHAYFK